MAQSQDSQTLQQIATMTDFALFERLAMAVLRYSKPNYEGMVHTGVNTAGQTVKDPLDGVFARTDSVPPEYILVEQTTESDLDKKWLNIPANRGPRTVLGDVHKATKWATDVRRKHPDANITLILTCNQRVNSKTYDSVVDACSSVSIELDIWDAARLSEFLDIKADGQWIRRKYLGITQERLSLDQFGELCCKSVERHTTTLFDYDLETDVARPIDQFLIKHLKKTDNGLTLLLGDSGFGKSVATQKILKSWSDIGFGLWLPDEIVDRNPTLESALSDWLTTLSPGLEDEAGQSAMRLSSQKQGLLIGIDDLNRSQSPSRLLEKLFAWSNVKYKSTKVIIICPIWPRILDALSTSFRTGVLKRAFNIGRFRAKTSVEYLIRNTAGEHQLTHLEASDIARSLGGDPLLLAMWISRWKTQASRSIECSSLVYDYINDEIKKGSQSIRLAATDCWNALEKLASWMLTNNVMVPRWSDILASFSEDSGTPAALRCLALETSLCGLEANGDVETFRFKHDRLRDHVLAKCIANHLNLGDLSKDILEEPYYAEIIGQSLLLTSDMTSHLPAVMADNPLAGFEALRLVGTDQENDKQTIADACLAWLDNNPKILSSLRWAIENKLSLSKGSQVLSITEKLNSQSMPILVARLRNGDLLSGIKLCIHFEPSLGSQWRDTAINDAMNEHGHNLIEALKEYLRKTNLTNYGRKGTLRLAGHMSSENLAPAIAECWHNSPDKTKILADALWAALNCCSDDKTAIIEMMNHWRTLSNEHNEYGMSPRNSIAEPELRMAFTRGLPQNAILFLIHQIDDDLKWPIMLILSEIDHPDAVECIVRQNAKIQEQCDESEKYSPWLMSSHRHWNPDWTHGKSLSVESMERLLSLWDNEAEPKYVRQQAFYLWSSSYRGSPDCLRKIPQTSPFYRAALGRRMLLGDRSTLSDLPTLLHNVRDAGYWLQFFPPCWNLEFKEIFTSIFDSYAADQGDKNNDLGYHLSKVLFLIPYDHAEELLLRHWPKLKDIDRFFQLALFLATPSTLPLVEKIIAEQADPRPLFKHLSMNFGFKEKGRSPIKKGQLIALEPYLQFLGDLALLEIWERANKLELRDWANSHVFPLIDKKYRHHFFDSDTFIDKLENIARGRWRISIHRHTEDALDQGISRDHIVKLASQWIAMGIYKGCWRVFRDVMISVAQRSHLEVLTDPEISELKDASIWIEDIVYAVKRRTLE